MQTNFTNNFSNSNVNNVLQQNGFPLGLIQNIIKITSSHPIRFWIIDNSGSMQTRDAHRTWGHSQKSLSMLNCTRWEEVQDCVYFQMDIAGLLGLRSDFTMINDLGANRGPSKFSVGGFDQNNRNNIQQHSNNLMQQDVQSAKRIIAQACPTGATPLTKHIHQIQKEIAPMVPYLKRTGKLATVILITDGLPSDAYGNEGAIITQKFVDALKTLENLPVWLVIRLCTDDDAVVEFYNNLDTRIINLDVDVLDDYYGESVEVFLRNPWLNYALPLHRFREIGFRVDIFDAIDERPLSLNEIQQLCSLLFLGNNTQHGVISLPDPNINIVPFLSAIFPIMNQELPQWNPIHKKLLPWIDLQRLHYNYASGGNNVTVPPSIHSTNQPLSKQDIYNAYAFGQSQTTRNNSTGKDQQYHSQSIHPHVVKGNSSSNSNNQKMRGANHLKQTKETEFSHISNTATNETKNEPTSFNQEQLKRQVLIEWALNPPSYASLRPVSHLVNSLHVTFPPAFGLKNHEYFRKWKPFPSGALDTGDGAVLKKAVRKTKVFLHPDKRPKDLSPELQFLFKMLWDVVADAWEKETQ